MLRYNKKKVSKIQSTISNNIKNKRKNSSIGKSVLETLRIEYFKELSNKSFNSIGITSKYTGVCYGDSFGCSYKISLNKSNYIKIGEIQKYLNNKENLDIKDLNDYLVSYKVVFHEVYHTRNKIGTHFLEEAITELNAHLTFYKHFKNITGINVNELNLKYLSYDTYIEDYLYLMKNLGFTEKEIFDITYDIKHFDTTYETTENNAEKARDLRNISDIIDFIIFIKKYYKKDLYDIIFNSEDSILFDIENKESTLSVLEYGDFKNNTLFSIIKNIYIGKGKKRKEYYHYPTKYVKSEEFNKDLRWRDFNFRTKKNKSLIETIKKYKR